MTWRRTPAVLVGLGLVVGVVVADRMGPQATTPFQRITETADQNVAATAARRQHEPVLVTSLGTPTRKVSAQPDGTMLAELSAEPMQVKRGERWLPVDPTLTKNNGVVTARTVTTPITLSGGGATQPLLRYGPIAVTWPGPLPAPKLDGPTATYPDVLPGVDLTLTATATSVSQHLVVRTRQAAQSITRIPFGITADGLALSVKDNALLATDAGGKVVYGTPPATMWDASEKRTAPVGLELTGSTLTLVPDQGLLTDPDATFPITIDPDYHPAEERGWAKVFTGHPGDSYWYGGIDDGFGKVGSCTGLNDCAGVGTSRTYFQFDTSFLGGKHVLDVKFAATIVHSPSCDTAEHQLYIANSTFGSGLTWNNQPGATFVDRQTAQGAWGGTCAGNKGIEFTVGGFYSPSNWSAYSIRAADEAHNYAWRRYDVGSTRLRARYNIVPGAPTDLTTEPNRPVCRWCDGKSYVRDDVIRLKGRIGDGDNDNITARWDIRGGSSTEHHDGPTIIQGNLFTTDVDLRNRNGQTVTWTLYGWDGTDNGPSRAGTAFVVDRIGVTTPPTIAAGLYQGDDRWHGGVDVPGTFTFGSAGVADIDHFEYTWGNKAPVPVDADALGGRATVTVMPPGDGPQNLVVRSFDRAGNPSPETTLRTYVRPGSGAMAQYSFEGNANDTAYLGDRHGTATGGVSYLPGAVGTAASFDGTGYVTTTNTVRTDASFSVSAWARINPTGGAQAIVSQDGTTFAGFDLWWRPDNGGRWVFAMADPDATQGNADIVWSAAPAQPNTWTQLTGVYDAAANQLRLYVNGVLSASVAKANVRPENSTGPVRIGRTMWDSHPDVDFVNGAIDEVKLYDRVVSDAEIAASVNRDNVQVGYWKFDETSGTTAANTVPGGSKAVLRGNAHFTQDGAVKGALQIDDSGDVAQTDGPVLRTDQSFSVALWARLDQSPVTGGISVALSQDGDVNSAFLVGYRNLASGPKWEVYSFGADATTHPGDAAIVSDVPAKVGEWTHLAAVYDAQAGKLRIYVNGVLAGTTNKTVAFNGTGPMVLGRNRDASVDGNPWHGAIDEVRAYSRVLSGEEIRGIVGGDNVMLAEWKLDGNTVSSPAGHDGSPVNGTAYTAGQAGMPDSSDLAARLDATGQQSISAPHVVDVDRSFAVAAWARADKLGGLPAVVSEDGTRISAFKVRANDDGRWSFVMFNTDDPGASRDEVLGGTVQLGQWTHLVAVYDSGVHQLQLYVNGVLAGSAAHTQSWNPAGGFQIGRAKWAGAPVEWFTGAIDDVSVYSRPLFASEIQAMAGRDLTLVHEYPFDESSGRNAADAVGARGATLTGNTTFTPGRVGNSATFDGDGDAATTTGVDLRTDQAFTVSALMRMPTRGSGRMTAVSIDGAATSKFRLGYLKDAAHPLGVWLFEMPESDSDSAPVTQAAVSTVPSDVNWTHLVGVYDPATKKIWLYVNGTRVGDGTLNTPWQASGGLVVGRGQARGLPAEYWNGSVDDVRLYTGQLDRTRVSALFHSYPAETGTGSLPVPDAGAWNLDENTGTTANDSSGRGMNATLRGGTGWVGGRNGPAALNLDGTSGYAETSGPIVDTSRSFTVAAWAYLTATPTGNLVVLGQDGTRLSTFSLAYNGAAKKWMALVPTVDADNPGQSVTILNSTEPATPGEWTHLAMSYDPNLRQVRLYVNGMLSAAQVGVTVLPAKGPFSIGRGRWNGGNAAYFPQVIDEVRAYSKVLTDGEVRRLHDDVVDSDLGYYRFDDGTPGDSTWRHYDATPTDGVTYEQGVSGGGAKLDGTGFLTGPAGLPMHDSFTVSGWARLTRGDRIATVVSQDGARMSGYALQYRPELNRWVFAGYTSDSDGAPLAYATDLVPPKLNEWTHLAGVYDYPARQLRLYVNGQLVGSRNNVVLWPASGKVVVGRGRINGASAGFFTGSLDEVRIAEGVVTDDRIAVRGGWAAPQGGQLGRFVNGAGDHYTGSTDQVRSGYHFEGTLGRPAAAGANTTMLHACQGRCRRVHVHRRGLRGRDRGRGRRVGLHGGTGQHPDHPDLPVPRWHGPVRVAVGHV
ncbi:LamG domain-containing protein [Actinophytocola oryzae]|uniref:Concanavalin A-like lectin/glucanase superfamily protein n=1 Tax=Actinophytocola oryzae TaxID=502181 RepID=A0A4R7W0N9_9PSEU|nr:LamG domain-containing protein [Actinophytocola oryzae]TDV56086.1 concanavalin A-like lectin/glucanase superfamily protein [Actinophytocola oryzae]